MHILLVDDDQHFRKALRRALVAYRVTEAGHGREALALLIDGLRPDLILCDVEMPVLSGEGLCRVLRENTALARIPIVMMSGHPEVRRIAEAGGAMAGLEKPFEVEKLYQMIATVLGQSA
jgi:CheY-like chemotaxis protein